ncbi:MAG: FHA domain-containing protein, partial [Leptolyngbyaceae bacterium]|nr:FHA domain-containing protein [Leptolyngbyaceae bacterium]
ACYTPLPAMLACPACGASVQSDASFCGQCGANLAAQVPQAERSLSPTAAAAPELAASVSESLPSLELPDVQIPDLVEPDALAISEPLVPEPDILASPVAEGDDGMTPSSVAASDDDSIESGVMPMGQPAPVPATPQPPFMPSLQTTQLQTQTVRLIHTQTNTTLELPPHLTVIHIGKPNDRVPPDIDVSGFTDSEVVSRVHADIRVEGDQYYLEDVGSSNGTYVNNVPLLPGNRHRLRAGDRIAFGKGDKVSFILQIS